jgi:hypothetical protein
MRRMRVWLLIVSALALIAAGAAVAHGRHGKTHTDSVSATLAATQSRVSNKTCTGEDGSYKSFRGKWSGTSVGDPRLTGDLRLFGHGLVNTTTGNGQASGWFSIRGDKSAAVARFVAVVTGGSTLNGYVIGWAKDKSGSTTEETAGSGKLLGSLSGTIAPDGALAAKIGTGAAVATANIQGGGCSNGEHDKKHGKRR